MFPPKVSDQQIRSLIAELSRGGRPPSGVVLRRALAERYGSRGGVSRIYTLLSAERRPPAIPLRAQAAPPEDAASMQVELHSLREQLQLARERGEADQSRWAHEIDRLRLKVAQLEPLAQQSQMLRETADLLRHRLQAADVKLGHMEAELLRAMQRLEERGGA